MVALEFRLRSAVRVVRLTLNSVSPTRPRRRQNEITLKSATLLCNTVVVPFSIGVVVVSDLHRDANREREPFAPSVTSKVMIPFHRSISALSNYTQLAMRMRSAIQREIAAPLVALIILAVRSDSTHTRDATVLSNHISPRCKSGRLCVLVLAVLQAAQRSAHLHVQRICPRNVGVDAASLSVNATSRSGMPPLTF